ncbi:DUF3606 domain-containing protein [Luteibacter sp. CQ10]|uniref:DUF3606 domain-containing protein n=1 Tax=Luteibacter sp. CQ10 TaxID=2805821 RepID=UPI0034A107B8
MSDSKSHRGGADRERINVNEDYEVRYWTQQLGISESRLREVVGRVGPMTKDVRAALKS